MTLLTQNQPVLEMRVALTTNDFDQIKKFYCDGLGLEPSQFWNNGQGRTIILGLGRATLEILDESQAQTVDEIEAERRVSGQIRFAFKVPDLINAMALALDQGAILVHEPVMTPWGDYNGRLQDPDGIQITLFQAKDD
ncbi:MAG: VOC family protein [Brevefilum sp.]|nr:VOC family protein [Brevefilum sp.]